MERWQGSIAVVTGASSGIGLATSKALLREGLIVVGLARRKEKMETDMADVTNAANFHARQCDITDEASVNENFNWVKQKFGTMHVLINNAGIFNGTLKIEHAPMAELDNIFKVNVIGLLHCTKEAIPMMKTCIGETHIINVNSILGHRVISRRSQSHNVYPATKFAVRGLSETLTHELRNSRIRVSSVSPGLVRTEISDSAVESCPSMPVLEADDIANTITYILGTPPHVEIVDIILEAKG